ncbi:AAA family ATPase [Candidatus Peribacteria bacterium]|nr:AAA family ATPase [Candidatus Peribacteria bacterium]
MQQSTAIALLKSGRNILLTGSAGTGKTYVLQRFIQSLREHHIPVAITATTGIAATHIGGQTIHSWSGMGIREHVNAAFFEKILQKKKTSQPIQHAQVLIIDEISMMHRRMLQNLDQLLRYVRSNFEPFGGLQVVLCGDFFQLPPIATFPEPSEQKYCFMAPAFAEGQFTVCFLTQQYRQDDHSLAGFLNEIRSGTLHGSSSEALNACMVRTQQTPREDVHTRLYTHNADVDEINARELAKLPTEEQHYTGRGHGPRHLVEALQKSVLAPKLLCLKIGARVMCVKNNPDEGYYNGTLGVVEAYDAETGYPDVRLHDGTLVTMKPAEWSITGDDGKRAASFTQIPLRLAWAITVHKSQGMTLESAEMDLSHVFEPGQGYVALSRVKRWEGLYLLGINEQTLAIDPLVLRADRRFQELSATAETFAQEHARELESLWEARIAAPPPVATPPPEADPTAYLEALPELHQRVYHLQQERITPKGIQKVLGLTEQAYASAERVISAAEELQRSSRASPSMGRTPTSRPSTSYSKASP